MTQTVRKKSVHLIRMKIDGKLREIQPNTHFNCPAGEVEYLTKAGAITDPKEVTAIEVVDDAPAVEEPAPAAKDSDDGTDEGGNVEAPAVEPQPVVEPETKPAPDLDSMREDELIEYGTSEFGLKLTKRMRVDTIRQKIREAQAARDEPDGDDNSDML